VRGVRPPLTVSWSKGRSGHYAYYHCWRRCRAVNISKTRLEGLFVDELKELQPKPGFMRLVKEHVLRAWEQRKTRSVATWMRSTDARRRSDRSSTDSTKHSFFAQSIDIDTYDRHKDKLRQELTLLEIDRHSDMLEKFNVEGILMFAERVLPRASDLWVQASLDQRQRLQQLFSRTELCSMENGLFEPA
jgi:hypothetical protein